MRRLAIVLIGVLALSAGCNEGADEPRKAAPKPPPPPPASLDLGHDFAVRVPKGTTVALREQPGGRVLATVGARTEFGSPQTLGVVSGRGDWVGVLSPALENGQVGWARMQQVRLLERPVQLEVDLSKRELTVREPDGAVRRISVGIGAPATATPPGDFYVTDKLDGAEFGSYYGCCILALSGRQPNLPEGWSGGDRLAIHGSPTPTWGRAVSNGCLHADEADLRYLMRQVQLGTYVRVHA